MSTFLIIYCVGCYFSFTTALNILRDKASIDSYDIKMLIFIALYSWVIYFFVLKWSIEDLIDGRHNG